MSEKMFQGLFRRLQELSQPADRLQPSRYKSMSAYKIREFMHLYNQVMCFPCFACTVCNAITLIKSFSPSSPVAQVGRTVPPPESQRAHDNDHIRQHLRSPNTKAWKDDDAWLDCRRDVRREGAFREDSRLSLSLSLSLCPPTHARAPAHFN